MREPGRKGFILVGAQHLLFPLFLDVLTKRLMIFSRIDRYSSPHFMRSWLRPGRHSAGPRGGAQKCVQSRRMIVRRIKRQQNRKHKRRDGQKDKWTDRPEQECPEQPRLPARPSHGKSTVPRGAGVNMATSSSTGPPALKAEWGGLRTSHQPFSLPGLWERPVPQNQVFIY